MNFTRQRFRGMQPSRVRCLKRRRNHIRGHANECWTISHRQLYATHFCGKGRDAGRSLACQMPVPRRQADYRSVFRMAAGEPWLTPHRGMTGHPRTAEPESCRVDLLDHDDDQEHVYEDEQEEDHARSMHQADQGRHRLGAPARKLPQYPRRGSKLHKRPPHYLV